MLQQLLGPEAQPTNVNAGVGQHMDPAENLPVWLTRLTPLNRQVLRQKMGEAQWAVLLQHMEPPSWMIFEEMGDWQQQDGGLGVSVDQWQQYLNVPRFSDAQFKQMEEQAKELAEANRAHNVRSEAMQAHLAEEAKQAHLQEQARLAEEARQAHLAEEARQAQLAEAAMHAQLAEEAKQAEQQKKIQEEKDAEWEKEFAEQKKQEHEKMEECLYEMRARTCWPPPRGKGPPLKEAPDQWQWQQSSWSSDGWKDSSWGSHGGGSSSSSSWEGHQKRKCNDCENYTYIGRRSADGKFKGCLTKGCSSYRG